MYCLVDIDEIKPISLTPEILEKNGWDKEEKDGNIFSLSEVFLEGDKDDEDNYTHFFIFYNNEKDGWDIDMRGNPLKHEIHYVHFSTDWVLITKWRCRYVVCFKIFRHREVSLVFRLRKS